MTAISISQLKANPAAAILSSQDFPVAIQNRSNTQSYLVGSSLFEKIIDYLEDVEDGKVIDKTDFSKGTDFEELASELGI